MSNDWTRSVPWGCLPVVLFPVAGVIVAFALDLDKQSANVPFFVFPMMFAVIGLVPGCLFAAIIAIRRKETQPPPIDEPWRPRGK